MNENCFLVRVSGEEPYKRCKFCNLELQQCFGIQSTAIGFFVVLSAFLIIALYDAVLARLLGVIIIFATLANLKIIDIRTNELVESQFKLREYSKKMEGARDYLETLFDSMIDGVMVIDKEYVITDINPAACRKIKQKKEEIVGRHCYEVSHNRDSPCQPPHNVCPLEEVIKSGKSSEVVHIHFDKDGKEVYVELAAAPLMDREGNVAGIIEVTRDITGRKRAEEELGRYSIELEHSNRLKDIFIDIMRHDLLTPVGIAKNSTELALEAEEGPEKRELLQMALSSSERLIGMIDSASILAKLESGEKLEFEEDDLGKILKSAVEDAAALAGERNTKIEITSEGEFQALVNPLVHDVFSNLLDNAIKYGPENSEVVVGIEEDGANWKISVADSGEGIPDDRKETIFERFTRVEKGGVKGTGLGLAIVKRIVEMHGGRVWVEDNPEGQGSVFFVSLPKKQPLPGT